MRQAFDRLVDAVLGRTPFPANPICLVTVSGGEKLLADLADRAAAVGATTAVADGESLGQAIEQALAADTWGRLRRRFVAADVIVVERLDALGGHIHQQRQHGRDQDHDAQTTHHDVLKAEKRRPGTNVPSTHRHLSHPVIKTNSGPNLGVCLFAGVVKQGFVSLSNEDLHNVYEQHQHERLARRHECGLEPAEHAT